MDAQIEFQGAGLRAQLKAAQRAAADMTPLMRAIGGRLEGSARTRIEDTNEAPDGTPWPKSFRVTIEGGKTLLDTKNLLGSLTYRATPNEVEIGTNVPYAAVHQFGATITAKSERGLLFRLADGRMVQVGEVKIPERPFLGISREDEEIISEDLVPLHWAGALADG